MRRVSQIVITILSAISLLLCLAFFAFGLRSLWVTDSYIHGGIWQPGAWNFVSIRGEFGVNVARGVSDVENRQLPNWRRDLVVFATGEAGPRTPTQPTRGVFIRTRWYSTRHWVAVVLFGMLATPWMLGIARRRRESRRLAHNQCRRCGYDLRASPERCPECGAVNPLAI